MKTVLDYAAQAPSLVALQEAHLLAQLMKIVLPVVSDDELVRVFLRYRLAIIGAKRSYLPF